MEFIIGNANMGIMSNLDIEFVKTLLPDHYTVVRDIGTNGIRCRSNIGLRKGDIEDAYLWELFKTSILHRFEDEFLEIDHLICSFHTDFIIHLKK